MKYKVLIADDEIHICRLIQCLVDWEDLGLTVVATVLSGVAALEYITKEQPDIVVSDIRMSGLSGIELMERVREAGIKSRFILVSGYKEFEFAKKAIALGVTDYLVKPIQKMELENALCKALGELGADVNALKKKTLTTAPEMQLQQFFEEICAKEQRLTHTTYADLLVQCQEKAISACFLYAWHFVCHAGYGTDSYRMMEDKAYAVIREQGSTLFCDSAVFRYADGLYMAGILHVEETAPALGRVLNHCTVGLAMLEGWKPVLGASEWGELETLATVMSRARHGASMQVFLPQKDTFFLCREAHIITDFHEVVPHACCDKLLSYLQLLDGESFAKQFRAVFEMFAETPNVSCVAVVRFCIWTCIAANQILAHFTTDYTKNVMHYWDRAALELELMHMPTLSYIEQRVLHFILDAMRHVLADVQAAENRPVRFIKQAVAERYMENLNLQMLAEGVGLNPVYLSSLFKKETGTNFKDYLTKTRMEIAKKCLRNGDSITNVTVQVGYHDTKYFSKTFTKFVGVTPSQYRKLFR